MVVTGCELGMLDCPKCLPGLGPLSMVWLEQQCRGRLWDSALLLLVGCLLDLMQDALWPCLFFMLQRAVLHTSIGNGMTE